VLILVVERNRARKRRSGVKQDRIPGFRAIDGAL